MYSNAQNPRHEEFAEGTSADWTPFDINTHLTTYVRCVDPHILDQFCPHLTLADMIGSSDPDADRATHNKFSEIYDQLPVWFKDVIDLYYGERKTRQVDVSQLLGITQSGLSHKIKRLHAACYYYTIRPKNFIEIIDAAHVRPKIAYVLKSYLQSGCQSDVPHDRSIPKEFRCKNQSTVCQKIHIALRIPKLKALWPAIKFLLEKPSLLVSPERSARYNWRNKRRKKGR